MCTPSAVRQTLPRRTSRPRSTLTATGSLGLCLAAARITRELIRAQLEADGWAGLGLQLTRSATAAALVFPRLDPSSRTVTTSDFVDPDHDDRYPDFLRLTRITPDHRHQIWARTRDALATVPHHGVVLTHDTTRSRRLLAAQAMVGKVGLETS